MSFGYASSVITQTGTDTSLAGLSGVTGVTVRTSDPTTAQSGRRWYIIDSSTRLVVSGTLTIDPDIEELVLEKSPTEDAAINNNPLIVSGTLNLGVARTGNGNTNYSSGIGINLTADTTLFYLAFGVYVSGTLVWNGGIIRTGSTVLIGSGATLTVNKGVLYNASNTNTIQLRLTGTATNFDIYDLELTGLSLEARLFSQYGWNTGVFTFSRGRYQTWAAASPTVTLDDFDVTNNVDTVDIRFETLLASTTGLVIVQNASRRLNFSVGTAHRDGYARCYRQLATAITDLNGDDITYSYYGVDIDNGSRTTGPDGFDDTDDIVYSGIDVSGDFDDNILWEIGIVNDDVLVVDDRTNANDTIPINFIGYNENITEYTPQLIGLGDLTETLKLTPDLSVTQATKATVDAYTGYETAQKAYDGAKAYLYDNYAGESQVLIGRVGNQLDLDGGSATALVFDSDAASKLDYTGTTLTYDLASDYTGGCTGTGTFTISGAYGLDGGTFDNSGGVVYDSSETDITDVTCAGAFDFTTAGTYTLSGCDIDEVTNSSGGAVTITAIDGTTINTNTGPSITINYQVDLFIDGLETDSTVRIEKVSDGSEISLGTESGGEYEDTHNYTGNLAVKIIVRKYGYDSYETTGTITSTGLSATVAQVVDPFVVLSEAAALALTGLTYHIGTNTIEVTGTRSVQDIYDWQMAQSAQEAALQYDIVINTVNGITFSLETDVDVSAGGTLTSPGGTQLEPSGSTVTTSGGGAITADLLVAAGASIVLADIDNMTGRLTLGGTGDWEIAAAGTAPSGSATATDTVEITTASPSDVFDFSAFTFDSSTVLENSSGSNITVNLLGAATAPTLLETSGTITIARPVDVALTSLETGTNVRIEKTSDNSLLSEGSESSGSYTYEHDYDGDLGVNVICRVYGYLSKVLTGTITATGLSFEVDQVADAFVVANESTASSYTGISLDYSARTGDISENHTVQELYDYEAYAQTELTALTHDPLMSTTNGLDVDIDMDLELSSTAVLSSSTQRIVLADTYSLTVASGTEASCDISVSTSGQLVAADIDDITGTLTMTSTADWEIAAAGTAPSGSAGASATIEITTASPSDTFDFAAFTFDSSTTLENSSGSNISVNVLPGATTPTKLETSGTITFTANASVTAPDLIDDTRVQLYNVTKDDELDNSVVSGGSGYSYSADTATSDVDVGDTLRLRHFYVQGTTCKQPESLTGTLTTTGLAFSTTQTACPVYEGNGIDGSTVTEYAADYPNVQVDIDDPDATTTVQRLYAWFAYNMQSEDGIRNFYGGMVADDSVNYKIVTSLLDLTLDNVGDPVVVVGARLYRDDAATVIYSGSGSIQMDPDKAYLANADVQADVVTALGTYGSSTKQDVINASQL